MHPHIARGIPLHRVLGALHREHCVHLRQLAHGLIHLWLERQQRAATPRTIRRDDRGAAAIENAVHQGLRAEAAKHHRMRHTDARTRKHGDRCLRNHRHVDGDAVALLQAATLEHIGKARDLDGQLGVGQRAHITGFAFKDQRPLVAAAFAHMPVDARIGHIDAPIDEPLGKGCSRPIQHLVKRS